MMMLMDKVTKGTRFLVWLQLAIPWYPSRWMTGQRENRHAASLGPPSLMGATAVAVLPRRREDPGAKHRPGRPTCLSRRMTLRKGKQGRRLVPGPRSRGCEENVLEGLVTRRVLRAAVVVSRAILIKIPKTLAPDVPKPLRDAKVTRPPGAGMPPEG